MVELLNNEYLFESLSLDDDEKLFHCIIGHIEDILMDHTFLSVHNEFMEKYWEQFEDTDENKFIYTDIYNEYANTVEKHIEEELIKRVPNFNMNEFEKELQKNKYDGEIFEMLSTFTDFCAFKAMFIDYKNMKEGKSIDFSADLCISKYTPASDTEDDE